MLLEQHRKLNECSLDLDALRVAKPDLLLAFAPQVLNTGSHVARDEEVKAAARTFKQWRALKLVEEYLRGRRHLGWTRRK